MRLGFLDLLLSKWLVAIMPIANIPHLTDWVSGASMMIRQDVFKQVGLLDEHYFMYFEEVDFCIRARRAGWTCWYVPQSRVIHLEGAASGISDPRKKAPRRRPAYWFESRHRFFLKNYGSLALMLADILWMAGFSLWRVRRILQRKPDSDPPHFLKDFFTHSFFCKGLHLKYNRQEPSSDTAC
jgi:GT2 family glycosyltransferase